MDTVCVANVCPQSTRRVPKLEAHSGAFLCVPPAVLMTPKFPISAWVPGGSASADLQVSVTWLLSAPLLKVNNF